MASSIYNLQFASLALNFYGYDTPAGEVTAVTDTILLSQGIPTQNDSNGLYNVQAAAVSWYFYFLNESRKIQDIRVDISQPGFLPSSQSGISSYQWSVTARAELKNPNEKSWYGTVLVNIAFETVIH